MDLEQCRDFCLSLKETKEGFPFDDRTIVFTVKGKMFCLTDIETFEYINIKCDPEEAIELRERYDSVTPGFHMNKNHWNSVKIRGNIPDKTLKEWITNSYNLIVLSLPKKVRGDLNPL